MHSIQSKTILNKTRRRDPWFLDDYTVNPYSACSYNCLFCYIRGSKYGEHMERKLALKENAVELLDKALSLRARKNQYGIIVLSSATEPYLQAEAQTGMTRNLLEVILKYRFPLHVITRSNLVVRDFDILEQIAKTAILPADLGTSRLPGAFITFSFCSTDDEVARIFEPGAIPASARLKVMQQTSSAGFLTGASLMPLLPYISDSKENIRTSYRHLQSGGARYIFPAGITLFGEGPADSKTLVLKVIEKHYPHLLEAYRQLFRFGHQLDWKYRNELNQQLIAIKQEFNIPDSILNAV